MSRALRRHHMARIKKQVLQHNWFKWLDKKDYPHVQGKLAHTRCLCSCAMCGNERKYHGEITMQEKRHLDKMKYDLAEMMD
ncbi:hypothetical protein [Ralstonia phage RP13]|nr:hypothetical protein [Ralstonia phage RP13]